MVDGHSENGYVSDLTGSYALVTAGYRNLGLIIAKTLKDNGITPVITYRSDEEEAISASEKLDCPLFRADLTHYDDVMNLFDTMDEQKIVIGILINNASSFHTGGLLSMDESEIRNTVEGCIYPAIFTTQFAAKRMKRNGFGRIVNIGMAGISEPRGYDRVPLHAAAKTALLSLTLSYARELGPHGITVNMVSPGIIDRSGYNDPDRFGGGSAEYRGVPPEDVAAAIFRLISDGSLNGVNNEVGGDIFR